MPKIVDARELACPQPVILTRKALKENDLITTIVDNETSQYNVTRMAEKMGCTVNSENLEDGIYLSISKKEAQNTDPLEYAKPTSKAPIVLVISSNTMGKGEFELGTILMRSFFHTLGEIKPIPDTIVFYNSGVKLTVIDSPILEDLKRLDQQNVEILVCGTCLEFTDLKDKLAVGEISNMYTIAEIIMGAEKVANI